MLPLNVLSSSLVINNFLGDKCIGYGITDSHFVIAFFDSNTGMAMKDVWEFDHIHVTGYHCFGELGILAHLLDTAL